MGVLDKALFWGGFAVGASAAYKNIDVGLSKGLGYLSSAEWAKDLITRLPLAEEMVERFVAGETIEDAIRVARRLNADGFKVSLDYLGEDTLRVAEANAARAKIVTLLSRIHAADLDANVSVKLSQLGLSLDPELAYRGMEDLLQDAKTYNNWVRIDMEDSSTVDATLDIYSRLLAAGCDNVGVVIQSYLYRSMDDVRALTASGARVRLCKGAYNEPEHVAYPVKADTDANYVRLLHELMSPAALANGVQTGIATHDNDMVEAALTYISANDVSKDAFEFQMLYGVREELQKHLLEEGYAVRIYVPFGEAWYPYLMRRLAERPANLAFFLSNL